MSTKVNGSAGKASDECYTPPLIYEAVKDWACQEYNIAPETIVRPFFPDGDYEHYNYPKNCTVLDCHVLWRWGYYSDCAGTL